MNLQQRIYDNETVSNPDLPMRDIKVKNTLEEVLAALIKDMLLDDDELTAKGLLDIVRRAMIDYARHKYNL